MGVAFSVVQKLTVLSLPHEVFLFSFLFLLFFFDFFSGFRVFLFLFLFLPLLLFLLPPGLPPRSLSYLPFLFCFLT